LAAADADNLSEGTLSAEAAGEKRQQAMQDSLMVMYLSNLAKTQIALAETLTHKLNAAAAAMPQDA